MDTTETDIQSNTLWNAEAKTARQWITDMFTRVHTKCDIPVNAVFGPCELKHTSVYDSIAFIALKSMDRRTAPYIIKQVDTSGGAPVWLRLVQSARCPKEQNLSAYVKNGQLFYRALRSIDQEEELLVWYSKDLAKLLLLLNPLLAQNKGISPYTCTHCKQHFESEFPFLAHQRFLCTQRLSSNSPQQHTPSGLKDYISPGPKAYTSHSGKPESRSSFKRSFHKDDNPGTDFHNLAVDVEKRTDSAEARGRNMKRKHFIVEEEEEERNSCNLQPSVIKLVPKSRGGSCALQKSNPSLSHPPTQSSSSISLSMAAFSLSLPQPLRPVPVSAKAPTRAPSPALVPAPVPDPASAPTPPPVPVLPRTPLTVRAGPPTISLYTGPGTLALGPPLRSVHPLYSTALFLQTQTLLPQIQALPSPHVHLSPPLSPLRLHAQNWCARCSLTFRLTSDLVAHMRTRHQGALSADTRGRSPGKEPQHSCSICREVFKQRHHLARHLAAHIRSPTF